VRVATYLLRVELPDRPGALGAVASRIGAVRADVVAVDIIGRGQGRAVDEFVVELTDDDHVPLMLSEISEVDGIKIEAIHPLVDGYRDGRLDAYDTAVALLRERTPHGALNAIATRTRRELDASWAVILDSHEGAIIASAGRVPAAQWLVGHIRDARRSLSETVPVDPTEDRPADDTAWVDLAAWDLVLLVGRPSRPLGRHDQLRLAALARIADARWADLAERDARLSHPSRLTPLRQSSSSRDVIVPQSRQGSVPASD
jgi:ACT domain